MSSIPTPFVEKFPFPRSSLIPSICCWPGVALHENALVFCGKLFFFLSVIAVTPVCLRKASPSRAAQSGPGRPSPRTDKDCLCTGRGASLPTLMIQRCGKWLRLVLTALSELLPWLNSPPGKPPHQFWESVSREIHVPITFLTCTHIHDSLYPRILCYQRKLFFAPMGVLSAPLQAHPQHLAYCLFSLLTPLYLFISLSFPPSLSPSPPPLLSPPRCFLISVLLWWVSSSFPLIFIWIVIFLCTFPFGLHNLLKS